MHFLYVDEAGHSGTNLDDEQQPVFVMGGVVVSDEKWRKTRKAFESTLEEALGDKPGSDFELHSEELLGPEGRGPFEGWERARRNELAHALLDLLDDRSHQVLIHWIHKPTLKEVELPKTDYGIEWKDPWAHSFHVFLTMFEEFLRSSRTGASSNGLVIADHSEVSLDYLREVSRARRREGGWKRLKKVVEIGYSAASHANPMIQLADLVAFTMKKWAESQTPFGREWPEAAHQFFGECREKIWRRVELKTVKCNKLKVPKHYRRVLREVRTPDI